ncbi:hypothetical protein [Prevotella sp. 10(H)]|nr:hypothetical protein [Prevotella sp. 10(H)]
MKIVLPSYIFEAIEVEKSALDIRRHPNTRYMKSIKINWMNLQS